MANAVKAIQNAIIKTLASEQNNAGTNPTGRLPTVKSIGKAWVSAIPGGAYPYVGVLPVNETRTTVTVGLRLRKHVTTWHVLCAVTSAVSLEDAYDHLHTMLDDDSGNGVSNVLEDPANFSLGGGITNLTLSQVEKVDYFDDLLAVDKQAGTSSYAAYAILQFQTVCHVQVVGAIH